MSEVFSDMQKNSVKALTEGDSILANKVFKDMERIRKYDQEAANKILKEPIRPEVSFPLASLSSNWRIASAHAVAVADVATNLAAFSYRKRD